MRVGGLFGWMIGRSFGWLAGRLVWDCGEGAFFGVGWGWCKVSFGLQAGLWYSGLWASLCVAGLKGNQENPTFL